MPIEIYPVDAVIPLNNSASQAIPFADWQTVTLWMPQAWTTAVLTIQASRSGITPVLASEWLSLFDGAQEVSLPAAAGRVISASALLHMPAGARWLRFISGTSAAPVNQAAARTVTAVFRRM